MIPVRFTSAAAILLAGFLSAAAHEFRIEPLSCAVAKTDSLNAGLRDGQFFGGPTIPYMSGTTGRFEVIAGDDVQPRSWPA